MEFGLEPYSFSIILLGLAVGAFVKGLPGMGLPLVAAPLMAGFLGAEHAIVVLKRFKADAAQERRERRLPLRRSRRHPSRPAPPAATCAPCAVRCAHIYVV